MTATTRLVTGAVVSLLLLPAGALAQTPVSIREQTPGLLAQAKVAPAAARLAAFAEIPGAQMVSAAIERRGDQLVYVFDLKYADHASYERVEIDAVNGNPVSIEYCVQLDSHGNIVTIAPPELVAHARARFAAARDSALARVPDGRVARSSLRVEQSRRSYVFDIEVGEEPIATRVLVAATTGAVVSVELIDP